MDNKRTPRQRGPSIATRPYETPPVRRELTQLDPAIYGPSPFGMNPMGEGSPMRERKPQAPMAWFVFPHHDPITGEHDGDEYTLKIDSSPTVGWQNHSGDFTRLIPID